MSAEYNLRTMGIKLPSIPKPAGKYAHYVVSGNMIYLSGKGPFSTDGSSVTGKVGADVTVEQAREHARSVGLLQIAVLKAAVRDLSQVRRIVKVLGMVNATPDFTEHPKVIDGFSELMVEVFGNAGLAARSAVGMGSLPSGITVEIEAIVELQPAAATPENADTP